MHRQTLVAHILQALAKAQFEGRRTDLDELIREVGARRADVRSALSALHREGYLDVLRMRLTMRGFAIASALRDATLPALRASKLAAIAAA